ncbi:hypothetical protein CYMTET_21431 [Cymbomonas tetramitiformis]|uniref:Uncharacterized protein n=1 Tax=Cymbomonas tetramitiformis TaxID=36881 RepID=A0AAE0L2Z0_9CHLO|nr:hypothetical protein CYMTET_21431 [Cymbomonas tetramitiformis]
MYWRKDWEAAGVEEEFHRIWKFQALSFFHLSQFLTFLDRDDDGEAYGMVSRTDTDTAELRLIRLTQHRSHTLNTQGFRAQRPGPDKKKKRTMARARERPRKTMPNRGMGNNYYNERQTAVSLLVNHEWRGTNLMSWLTRQNGGLLQEKFLTTTPGLIDGTDWQAVKARFGQSEVAVTFTGGECLTGKLIKFATTCPVLYQFTLGQLVRVFEAVRSNIPWGQRAALRRKVCLAAKKAHGFPLRGVYVFKFPAAELWQKLDVRALARSALGQLRFAAFSSRNEDEDLDRFLPLGFDEKGTTYRAERNTDGW